MQSAEAHFLAPPRPFAVVSALLLGILVMGFPVKLSGATLPPGFTEANLTGTIPSPTAMAIAPDGRLFVCLQGGSLRVVKNGALLATPFVTVSVNSLGERGLLGVAFDPDFSINPFVYVYYTTSTSPVHNRISRFTANGDVAVAGSEVVLMDLETLSATNHNGGAIHFGPDGKLYVAVGENANPPNAQTLANRLGKMLRLNPDGSIPPDNPFFSTATGVNRSIWALGLRNPFTFTFQHGTGRMFINDVGQSTWEEIDDGLRGANYGWPTTEGATTDPQFVSPLLAYPHSGGTFNGCAITGGAFYNPVTVTFPAAYVGKYFFADYCAGFIKRFDPASRAVADFASGITSPVDLQVSAAGDLYYLARNAGVFRVRYTANSAPSITGQPASRTVSEGRSASFAVTASGSAPLAYQWQRGGTNISGATAATYTLASAQLSDNGAQFRCVVSNGLGSATSNTATLTVTADQPPTAVIDQPLGGTLYVAGQTIAYAGTGTDLEDGTLPASAFTWRVDFHHDTHIHPFVPDTTGIKSGSFTIPTSGETSANVWYRIHLKLKDSFGLTTEVTRDVLPRKAVVTLATSPTGLALKLDGTPVTGPTSFTGVAGIIRTLEATSPQTVNATTWVFRSWSDGGARVHSISTPQTNTTYTATFAKARAQITSPTPGATLPGSIVTFNWTAGTGVTRYQLDVGTAPAGTQVFSSGPVASLSATVTGVPTNGGTVYVRLWSSIGGNWEYDDYTYHAAPPLPTLSIDNVTVTEGNAGTTSAVFTINLSAPSSQTVTVHYATANGTAVAGTDYTAASGTLTFAAGATSHTITVAVTGDTVNEANETFTVNLSTPVNATIADGQGLGTITNDDAASSLPTLSINDVTVSEGNSGVVSAVFTVSLSAASTQGITVHFATANGTATAGSDYVALSGTLSFAAGTTTRTIAISVAGDGIMEADETFFVNLASAVNATILRAQGVGTIKNDDTTPPPSITVSTTTATPGQTVTVTVANGPGKPLDWVGLYNASAANQTPITWVYLNGTKTAPATGMTSATLTFTMPASAGVYNFRFLAGGGYTTLATTPNVVIKTLISINDVAVSEGNSTPKTATFTVSLSVPSSQSVTVQYATANGTATAGTDYVSKTGTLSFPLNTTSLTIAVTINGDTTVEPNETFFVNLSNPVNATISDGQGVGTITNDDSVP
jgi:glucose/arabinose dehydrogenase